MENFRCVKTDRFVLTATGILSDTAANIFLFFIDYPFHRPFAFLHRLRVIILNKHLPVNKNPL